MQQNAITHGQHSYIAQTTRKEVGGVLLVHTVFLCREESGEALLHNVLMLQGGLLNSLPLVDHLHERYLLTKENLHRSVESPRSLLLVG